MAEIIRFGHHGDSGRSSEPDRGIARRSRRARTARLRRKHKPFDEIDREISTLIERITPDEGEDVPPNLARAIVQAQSLRKDLLLGKLRVEEADARLEESDVRAEWEQVKRELGFA